METKDSVLKLEAGSTTLGLIADDSMRFDPKANLKNDIQNRFSYHPPSPEQPAKYQEIRDTAKEFALKLAELCPQSRELSTALTKLDEVVFWANASIARNEGK